MPFDTANPHEEAVLDAAILTVQPVLYAERVGLEWSPGTKLTDAQGRFVCTLFRLACEGEVWKRNPQDVGYRITWARELEGV